jgi:hypothetical protein
VNKKKGNQEDICCLAACVKVPCPNQAQVNATTECAGKCPQGNGTEGETAQYAACQSSCISSYFLTAVPSSTAASGSAATNSAATTGSAGTATASGGSGSSGGSSTASASGSSSTSSGAADHLQLGVTAAGILGLVAMAFAL